MRALRFHEARELHVEQVPEPGPPGPGEVLLRPLMCGICGTDLHEYTDGPIVTPARPHPLTGAELPQILGHEFAATVAAAGPGVTHVQAGRPVHGHAADPLRPLPRMPARPGAPVPHDGVHRAEQRLGRPGRPGHRLGRAGRAGPGVADPAAGRADRADRGRRLRRGPGPAAARADRAGHRGRADRLAGHAVRAGRRGPPGGAVRAGPGPPGPGRGAGRRPRRGDHRRPGRRAGHRDRRRPHRRDRRRPGDRVRRRRGRAEPVHRRGPPRGHRGADRAAHPARLDPGRDPGAEGPDPGRHLVLPDPGLPAGRGPGGQRPAAGRAGDQLGGPAGVRGRPAGSSS